MRNKSDVSGLSIWMKLRSLAVGYRQWLLLAGTAMIGYVMSNSFLFGGVAPFGVAFCAALPWKYVTAAALGALLGHIFTLGSIENMKYIAAVLLVVIFKWVLTQRLIRLPGKAAVIGSALFGMGLASALIAVTMDYMIYDVLSAVAEMMLCCGSAYFFARTLSSVDSGFSGASRADLSCIVVSFSIIVMGFSPVTAAGVSIGRVIAVFVVLMAARYGKEPGGAMAGITAGVAMGLAGGDFSYTVTAYAFGGLIAGIFGHVGRLASASAFVLINALAAIFVASPADAYIAVIEIFIASAAFMALPAGVVRKLRLIPPSNMQTAEGAAQLALRQRMGDISRTLSEISVATSEVSRRLGKMKRSDLGDIYSQVASRVCRHCGMRTSCWQERYSTTMSVMSDIVRVMRRTGGVNREQVPEHFKKVCVKLDSVLGELNTQFQMQLSREGVARKVSQVRSVVTDQFDGMSMMLDEIAADLATRRVLEQGKCLRISDYLEKSGLAPELLIAYADGDGRAHIELRLPAYQLTKLERVKASLDLSALLECEFDTPVVEKGEQTAIIVFSEKAAFTLQVGAFQIACGKNRLCGDAYETIRERGGRQHLILSDGMGSGGNAAVDSSMASGLIARLLGVGISHQAALKMVNSALLIKSGEESLATIDVCTIDLFTGNAGFYKAGAAPTYVLRAGKSGFLESTSLPAGILRGVGFEKSEISLNAGDLVVMVSDGVTATGTEWLLSEIKSVGGEDIQALCESLANTAAARRTGGHSDDITVLAAKLTKGI